MHEGSLLIDALVAQMVKHLPAMRETWVRSLGREDPLEKEMATHSSTPAWKIPWTEEPGRLQSMGSQRVGHDWATSLQGYFYDLLFVCLYPAEIMKVCVYHTFPKKRKIEFLFYAPWTGNYFVKTSSLYCICISGHQKCLRFNLPPWLECFFTGLSLHFVSFHKGEGISVLPCHFYRRVCFPVMELCDVTRFHSYIHLFIHLLTHLLQNYYESFMYRARQTYKEHRMWNQCIPMVSPPQWTCVWANSGKWWWTGKPDVWQSMGSQRDGHNWVTEQWQMASGIFFEWPKKK